MHDCVGGVPSSVSGPLQSRRRDTLSLANVFSLLAFAEFIVAWGSASVCQCVSGLERISLKEVEFWSSRESMVFECRSDSDGDELMSDRAGDRVVEWSVMDPEPSLSTLPSSLVSVPDGELAGP